MEKMNKRITESFTKRTADNHIQRWKRLMMDLKQKDIENNSKFVVAKLKTFKNLRSSKRDVVIGESTQLDLITTIKALIKKEIISVKEDQIEAYEARFRELKEKQNEQTKENKQSQTQNGRFIDYKIPIEYITNKARNSGKLIIEDVVIALYSLFPPRRADYRTIQITHEDPGEDAKGNYIIIKEDEVLLQFNEYKTQKNYGRQEFNLSKPNQRFPEDMQENMKLLAEILRALPEGKRYILINNKSKPYGAGQYSTYITNLYQKKFGVNINIDILRQSYRSYIDSNYRLTMINQKVIAEAMAHSLDEAHNYLKIDLTNNLILAMKEMDLSDWKKVGRAEKYIDKQGNIAYRDI